MCLGDSVCSGWAANSQRHKDREPEREKGNTVENVSNSDYFKDNVSVWGCDFMNKKRK